MKIIKNSFIILIFLGYFFIFGRQLDPEISFIPLRVENLEADKISAGEVKDRFVDFRLNGKFGYLNKNGEVLYSENLLYGVAIDDNGFINYSRQNEMLVIKDKEGRFLNTIELSGYPFFSTNRRFIVSYDSNGLSEIREDGSIVWSKTFSSSISSVSVTDSLVFIGTVDGRVQLLEPEGNVLFSYDTKSSRINVVYGGSVSTDGEHLVTITGIDPQLLSLWNKSGNEYLTGAAWSMSTELRRHAVTGFSDDGLYAYVEAKEELLIIELKNKKQYSIPMSGRLQNIYFHGNSRLIYILGLDSISPYLMISETDGNILFYQRLSGKEVMLKKDLNRIILGIDKKIIAYELESL
ncbi:MAG: PQQ-binding-like beta-propeller repeat protein [Spirochaetales bacterium]|nr:PQQ-binding-like beta-propeller repeat protein [Spirochaetales bacterium]